MTKEISTSLVDKFKNRLDEHPVYSAVETIEDLQCFMEHHVFSVWDFMSLVKYVQSVVAPVAVPWVPRGNTDIRRFINELVLEEESDEGMESGLFSSHFELYQKAMQDIGADISVSADFVTHVRDNGIESALALPGVPLASRKFTARTFKFIDTDKPHVVAAALALGREHIIPDMFRAILNKTGVSEEKAPAFYYYITRHIHLDEGTHAPMSIKLLNDLCAGDEIKIQEATESAREAIEARLEFWDGVLDAINDRKSKSKTGTGVK